MVLRRIEEQKTTFFILHMLFQKYVTAKKSKLYVAFVDIQKLLIILIGLTFITNY